MIRTFRWQVSALMFLALAGRGRADEAIYQRTLNSTVMVLNVAKEGLSWGSGGVVDLERRLIVTNYHVVGDAEAVFVVFPRYDQANNLIAERERYADIEDLERNGYLRKARIVVRDAGRDLALIELDKFPKGVQALPLAPKSARPGQRLHSIGNPGSSDALWVYTQGLVRAVYQKEFLTDGELKVNARVVESQSPVNHGDSGGPVVNDRGELVAIVQSFKTGERDGDARLLSIFIDVSEVRAMLQQNSKQKEPLVPEPAQPGDAAVPSER